jgi:hypothetical protein
MQNVARQLTVRLVSKCRLFCMFDGLEIKNVNAVPFIPIVIAILCYNSRNVPKSQAN